MELGPAGFTVNGVATAAATRSGDCDKALVIELARSNYFDRRENIIAVGNSGTGKSHIAPGLHQGVSCN